MNRIIKGRFGSALRHWVLMAVSLSCSSGLMAQVTIKERATIGPRGSQMSTGSGSLTVVWSADGMETIDPITGSPFGNSIHVYNVLCGIDETVIQDGGTVSVPAVSGGTGVDTYFWT